MRGGLSRHDEEPGDPRAFDAAGERRAVGKLGCGGGTCRARQANHPADLAHPERGPDKMPMARVVAGKCWLRPKHAKISTNSEKMAQMIRSTLSSFVAISAFITACFGPLSVQVKALDVDRTPQTILYGVAYYYEYTLVDRIDEDFRLMREANITVVRIAESTWGTLEPQPGVFNFSHVDRMLSAAQRYGIKVIVGTPTLVRLVSDPSSVDDHPADRGAA